VELIALHPDFGVEVRGIDLIDVASSDAAHRATRAALEEHSLLLFREQEVTDDVQGGLFPRLRPAGAGEDWFHRRRYILQPSPQYRGGRRAGAAGSGR
jgi:alpha-ketoglutarate-dependent taurine dioxygenase